MQWTMSLSIFCLLCRFVRIEICSNGICSVCLCRYVPQGGGEGGPGVSAPCISVCLKPSCPAVCALMVLLQVLQAGASTAAALIRDSEAATGRWGRAHHNNRRFDTLSGHHRQFDYLLSRSSTIRIGLWLRLARHSTKQWGARFTG